MAGSIPVLVRLNNVGFDTLPSEPFKEEVKVKKETEMALKRFGKSHTAYSFAMRETLKEALMPIGERMEINKYYEGISNSDYHANREFFSSSQLKQALDSHSTFAWYMNNGKQEDGEWKPSTIDARDFGSLVHALLLEPHTVNDDFLFIDTVGRNFRTKEDKIYKAKMLSKAENSGKIPLAAHALDKAKLCVESVKKHSFAQKLLDCPGKPEISGYFEEHGLKLRFRPDRLIDGAIVDVKTTQKMEEFEKKAKWTFHYDLSAAMYLSGHKHLTGELVDFYFLVVESQAPYRTAVYKCSDKFLERGLRKYEQACINVKLAEGSKFEPEVFQKCDWEMI